MAVLKKNADGTGEIPAFKFRQNGKDLVTFTIKHEDLNKFYFIEQFDEDNQKGNQRRLHEDHVIQFAEAIQEYGKQRPQSVVGTLCGGAKYKEKTPGFGSIILPKSAGGKFISIQDGQHSVNALDYVDDKKKGEWEWCVTAYLAGDWKDRTSTHLSINANQKKVDRSHLLHQSILIDEPGMDEVDKRTGRLLIDLDKDEESVLNKRIKLFDAQTKKLSLNDLIKRISIAFRITEVQTMSDVQAYDMLKNYFNIWKEQNKDVWEDTGNFIMSNILGIKVICRFLPEVLRYLIAKKKPITKENMAEVIQRSKTYSMNWSKTILTQEHGHQIETTLLKMLIKKTNTNKVGK